jgi:hypothetical protein
MLTTCIVALTPLVNGREGPGVVPFARQPSIHVAKRWIDANLVKLGKDASRHYAGCHDDTATAEVWWDAEPQGSLGRIPGLNFPMFRDGSVLELTKKTLNAIKKLSAEEIKASIFFTYCDSKDLGSHGEFVCQLAQT